MFKPKNRHGKGRPKGSENIATAKVREAFTLLIDDNLEQMQDDINQLEPKDRLRILIDLSAYVLPKLKQIDIGVEEGAKNLDIPLITFYKTPEEE